MDARTVVDTLRSRIEETLRPLVTPHERVAVIDFPNYPNVGDSAIYLGQLASLASLGVRRLCFACDFRTYDRAELARRLGPSGTILLTGGGSFGDLWPTAQTLREEIVRSFPRHSIIQLPQTIHFDSGDVLRRAKTVFDAHEHLTLLLRDARSLEIAQCEFRARSVLCPDMAFSLGPLPRPAPPTRSCVWLMRTDKESAVVTPAEEAQAHADWLDEPPMALREVSYRLMGAVRRRWLRRVARPLLMRVYAPLARQRLRRGLSMLASASVVITDRLHGHILSLLLGIPHVILDNSYGKLSRFHDTWTRDVEGVRWASSLGEARTVADALLGDPALSRASSGGRRG